MTLDRQDAKPLHQQLEDIIRRKLEFEEWPPNSMIPSENELSKEYGISRMTVRAVLNRIVSAGLLRRVPGKGTFVSSAKIESFPLTQMGIREQLERMGYETTTRLISLKKIHAPVKIQKRLRLADAAEVYEIARLRYVKDEPLSIHTSFIPLSICPGIDAKLLEEMQLCDILENIYGHPIIRRVETLESVIATLNERELLGLKAPYPLLMLENEVFTSGDTPMEYTKVVFRGDKIKLRIEYDKSHHA